MGICILIAPSGFKECLSAGEVADCIEKGILRALPDAKTFKAPLVDGGEGFTKALVEATDGTLQPVVVTGPVGQPVQAHYGFLGLNGPKTAVLEMASASGLSLVPKKLRDPLKTTTYGVGELIKATLNSGAERLLIGCGDSGTNDGGAGMAQALGINFLDDKGCKLGKGGGELIRLKSIDLSDLDPRIKHVQVDVACNMANVLCGPNGVARVFGPQKGASSKTVEKLASSLEQYAGVINSKLNIDIRFLPGSGASGGLGAGLIAFIGATLHRWDDIVLQYLELDELLQKADLVVTAEGTIDFQTVLGKIPSEIARRAKSYNLPVIALAGTIGKDAYVNFDHNIDSFFSILETPCTLGEAIKKAPELITGTTERVMRLIQAGQMLKTAGRENKKCV